MSRTRAWRRHQYVVRKKRWLRKMSVEGWSTGPDERVAAIYANTATKCSCYMCGNPRKWFKQKTRQELAAVLE